MLHLNLRQVRSSELSVLGPLENVDMVGLDLTFQVHDYILPNIERSTKSSPLLKQKQAAGELGFKTGKGFYEWSQEAIEECRKKLMEHLINWNREQHEEQE